MFAFAAIDFETTGSVPGFPNEPWQVGVLAVPAAADGAWLLRFVDRDGRRLAVAWTTAPRDADAPSAALLGFEPREARDLYGAPVLPFHPVSGRPVYYYQ